MTVVLSRRFLVRLNLRRLITAAGRHGPGRWTDRDRDRYGYRPSEVLAAIRADAQWMLTTVRAPRPGGTVSASEEYERAVSGHLRQPGPPIRTHGRPCGCAMLDPVVEDLDAESCVGDSQLRPRVLYPDDL